MRPHDLILTLCVLLFLLGLVASCTQTTKIVCPPLSPPPVSTVDALEEAGKKDPSSAAWAINLSKHYRKLDACQ